MDTRQAATCNIHIYSNVAHCTVVLVLTYEKRRGHRDRLRVSSAHSEFITANCYNRLK